MTKLTHARLASEELLVDFEKRRLDIVRKRESTERLQQQYERMQGQIMYLKNSIAAAGGVI